MSWKLFAPAAWEEHPDWPRESAISVTRVRVNRLLDIPIRYDPELVFRNSAGAEDYRAKIDITMIEFLKAIFYDLTVDGPPRERNEMRAETARYGSDPPHEMRADRDRLEFGAVLGRALENFTGPGTGTICVLITGR